MKRLIAALSLLPATLAAQQPSISVMADSVFARWNSTHTPGCAVGIARHDDVLFTRGYGMADLETGTPITPETIFESGSVAKQFTATAIVLLALDGKLDLSDDARKYVPELPDYGRPITIRHLLTHTSGLREWSTLVALHGWPRGTRVHTQSDLLDIVVRQHSLNYPVGEFYSYTNTGYALAATIVERVSGMSFREFSRRRIFEPLGMSHTQWRDDYSRLVPQRAQAYRPGRDGWHLDMPFEDVVGPGGLLTTVGDWLIWNRTLAHATLGQALVDSLTKPMRLNDGRVIHYGLGLFLGDHRGVHEISHSGSTAGYSTYLVRYPDRGQLSIAILCNSTAARAGTYAHELADALIDSFPSDPALDTTAVDSASFARLAGVYRNDRTHSPLRIGEETGRRWRALPDSWFWLPNGAHGHFELAGDGHPSGFRMARSDGDTLHYTWMAPKVWTPTPAELQPFVGRYHSDEVDATYEIRMVGDSLVVVRRAGIAATLNPVYPDAFTAEQGTVWFTRDRRDRVTAAHFSESRVWDLVMPRVQ